MNAAASVIGACIFCSKGKGNVSATRGFPHQASSGIGATDATCSWLQSGTPTAAYPKLG
jgi:hypothetical protein